jgi:hypothetical protein
MAWPARALSCGGHLVMLAGMPASITP